MLERVADELTARGELRFVVAAARHRERQAVRREQDGRGARFAAGSVSSASLRGRSSLR